MFESCLHKQRLITEEFATCHTPEERYQKLIQFGKTQSRLSPEEKIEENRVRGCQSNMYLVSELRDGLVYFASESDALISAGLAILLLRVYSGETPETILKCPPTYLEEIKIQQTLTPGRSNGLASLYLRMKQEALRLYSQQTR